MIDQRIRDYVLRMPGFSRTVTKVLEVCNRPVTSSHDLNRVISLDPVLTGRVLKLVNSAYYSLGQEVTSMTYAIILLGLNTVKNLALGTAIIESIGGVNTDHGLSMDAFWVHSLSVGVISRSLAQQKGVPLEELEGYFVAGLLHDLGKIPISHCHPEEYRQTIETAAGKQRALYSEERGSLGVDHCTVGGWIAEKWHLHRSLSDVFHHHHNPERSAVQNRHVVETVSLADLWSNRWSIGSAGNTAPDGSLVERLQDSLKVEPSLAATVYAGVLEDIDKARIFLQVTQKG
jgi:HD-like signal output (HDOD) protein